MRWLPRTVLVFAIASGPALAELPLDHHDRPAFARDVVEAKLTQRRAKQVASGHLKGVNLSGAEINGGTDKRVDFDYVYPTKAEIDYYASKGFGVIRVPFDLGRMQAQGTGQPLDPMESARLRAVIAYAATKRMRIIADPHTYGVSLSSNGPGAVGTDPAYTAGFADFWSHFAKAFPESNVIYGLMNEPSHQSAQQWHDGALPAIAAIRAVDGGSHLILVPGANWTGATSWGAGTDNSTVWTGLEDPNFAFEIHQYLDSDNSGTHAQCAVGVGASKLAAVTAWAKTQGANLFLGEFGWSADPSCPPEAKAFMNYVSANQDVWLGWTYWAGGPWMEQYMFTPEPQSFKAPVLDRPQMTILTEHL